ncbi:hypothetical protein MLD38_005877 [Melastoma candidum]|uniref:Uncharacterized protein n=1 Tax=Melastoma candidum TaxID=119954 RepID=A0ACB9RL55_9MYRT|nr:hypothetical protein MLD38_005877 [Melastoma candidum]
MQNNLSASQHHPWEDQGPPRPSHSRRRRWLKTVDQYFVGANNSIRGGGGDNRALSRNSRMKFDNLLRTVDLDARVLIWGKNPEIQINDNRSSTGYNKWTAKADKNILQKPSFNIDHR